MHNIPSEKYLRMLLENKLYPLFKYVSCPKMGIKHMKSESFGLEGPGLQGFWDF